MMAHAITDRLSQYNTPRAHLSSAGPSVPRLLRFSLFNFSKTCVNANARGFMLMR